MSLRDCAHMLDPARWIEDLGLIQDKEGSCQLDEKQIEILRSNHKRIIINCHRQWGKSQISSLLCFHRALFFERSLSLLVAPSLRQSSENFRKIADALNIIEPKPVLAEDTKLTLKFDNKSRIISLPGSQKTIRGFSSPDLIVVDEGAQAEDQLFEALFPMLANNPDGRIIICSTPWGQRGTFYKIWAEGGPEWLKVRVVASENPRISAEFLAEMRNQLGPWVYAQEFEGQFVGDSSQLFTLEMIKKAQNTEIPIISLSGD